MSIFWQMVKCKSGGKELALKVEDRDMPALMMQPDLSNLVVSGPVRNAALTAWQQRGWPGPARRVLALYQAGQAWRVIYTSVIAVADNSW